MREGILLLLPFASACAASAQPEQRAIVAPVVAAEANAHARDADKPVCVDTTPFAAFDWVRERLRELPAARNGNGAQIAREIRASLVNGAYDWRRYEGKGNGPSLSPKEAAPLDAAARNLIGRNSPPPVRVVDPARLPPPFVGNGITRCPTLRISAPESQGDIAFVETGFVCGGLCGGGQLYALRRVGRNWHIVAVALLWVS
jgi:hypothetical protein